MIVLLDTGILGAVTHPHSHPEIDRCKEWLAKKQKKKPEELRVKAADFDAFMRKALSAPPPPKPPRKKRERCAER